MNEILMRSLESGKIQLSCAKTIELGNGEFLERQ